MATITLNPSFEKNYSGGGATSALKSISFFLLFSGLVLITIGYVQQESRIKAPRVEFRYVPRSFKEQNAEKVPLMSIFGNLFSNRSTWSQNRFFMDGYPWSRQLIDNKNVVMPYASPVSGFGRSVGTRILG